MNNNRLTKIYNLIQEELNETPEDETISDRISKMYSDMQNLKETLTNYFINYLTENKKYFEYKEQRLIGLNKYLYIFDTKEDFEIAYNELEKIGTVNEIFINNKYGLEFKEDKRILDDREEFSEISLRNIKENLSKYYGIPVTFGDENVCQIQNEMGDIGVEIYEKYFEWYKEKGQYDIYEYIDAFCYGYITDIKEYLNEIIKDTEENEENLETRINVISEIKKDIKSLEEYTNQKEENIEL